MKVSFTRSQTPTARKISSGLQEKRFDHDDSTSLCRMVPTISDLQIAVRARLRVRVSVLSMRFRFGGRKFSKCACSELKTRTCSRSRTQI